MKPVPVPIIMATDIPEPQELYEFLVPENVWSTYVKAKAGEAESQYAMYFIYRYGRGVDVNPLQSAAWCVKSAEQGYADAQTALGLLYNNGEGVSEIVIALVIVSDSNHLCAC